MTQTRAGSVDLYQVHAFDPWTPLDETLRTLDGFIRAGKISYYGLSNFTGWQLTKTVHLANALGVAAPVTLQPQYSLIVREIEWEIVPAVLDAGMGMLPWSPLGGGWLSGKYQRDERPTGDTRLGEDPGRGMEAYDRRGTDRTWNVIDAVQKVAEDRGVSMAEVALAWVTDRPGVTSTILGARTTEQLETNLRAADLHLSAEETAALDQASDLHATDYPYGETGSRSAQPQPRRRPDDLLAPCDRPSCRSSFIDLQVPAAFEQRQRYDHTGARTTFAVSPSGRGAPPSTSKTYTSYVLPGSPDASRLEMIINWLPSGDQRGFLVH